MKLFYLSLVRGLIGYYVAFLAPSESVVREHASKYFGRMWCSVYTDKHFVKYPGFKGILEENNPIVLESPDWE